MGSPAAAAGLRPGDVIVELAGEPVRTVEDLLAALRQTDPGQPFGDLFRTGYPHGSMVSGDGRLSTHQSHLVDV